MEFQRYKACLHAGVDKIQVSNGGLNMNDITNQCQSIISGRPAPAPGIFPPAPAPGMFPPVYPPASGDSPSPWTPVYPPTIGGSPGSWTPVYPPTIGGSPGSWTPVYPPTIGGSPGSWTPTYAGKGLPYIHTNPDQLTHELSSPFLYGGRFIRDDPNVGVSQIDPWGSEMPDNTYSILNTQSSMLAPFSSQF